MSADRAQHTLSELVARLGGASEDEVRVQLEGYSDLDFIAKGRRMVTPQLSVALGRDYGRFADWLPGATLDQLDLLGFVEQDWLRIAVWAGRQWETRDEALSLGPLARESEIWRRAATADSLRVQGRRARDRMRSALEYLAAGMPTWKARLDQAYARSTTAEPVADALVALANIADAMLSDKSPGMVARRANSQFIAMCGFNCRTLAERVAAAGAAAAAAVHPPVSQTAADRWGGMAITFYEQFLDAVEDAHDEDHTIPAPSGTGLRGWLRQDPRRTRFDSDPVTLRKSSED
jgi:hypothetical protein